MRSARRWHRRVRRGLCWVGTCMLLLGTGMGEASATTAATSAATSGTVRGGPPVVASVTPGGGPASGRTTVTITGRGFGAALGVAFGGTGASSFQVDSDTRITAVAPPGTGVRDVLVITSEGISRPRAADFYAYGGARPPANTSLGSASGVATPTEVTLHLSSHAPKSTFAQALGRWCPLAVVADRPMAPLVCGVRAFSPATAIWDQVARTVTVYAGADSLTVMVGAGSATLTTPAGTRTIALRSPAIDPAGAVLLPLSALARIVGGNADWAPATREASVRATVYDPGMAEAEALLTALSSRSAASIPDVFGGPPLAMDVSYLRDVFKEGTEARGSPCRSAPPAGFVRSSNGTSSGRSGWIDSWKTFLLSPLRELPEIQIGLKPLSKTATAVRCDALVVDAPTRPAPDPVPAAPIRATVTLKSSGMPIATAASVAAPDAAIVRRLESIANALPVYAGPQISNGCVGNAAGTPTDVRIRFVYGRVGRAEPRSVTLDESTSCFRGVVSVTLPGRTYPDLYDPTLRLARAAAVTVRR